MAKRYIQRHSKQTRITHALAAICCVWLIISGCFVFIPQLAAANPDVTRVMRVSHRVVGVIFIVGPLLSALTARKGFKKFIGKYLKSWTDDDVTWLKKFVPYLLNIQTTHMPDQDEVKSGQIVSDGALLLGCVLMAISGVVLWVGGVAGASTWVLAGMRLVHDICFVILIVLAVMHAYIGAGGLQSYRGMAKVMWGNGQISESDSLYHWGYWAREQVEKGGDNILLKDDDGEVIATGEDAVRKENEALEAMVARGSKKEAETAA